MSDLRFSCKWNLWHQQAPSLEECKAKGKTFYVLLEDSSRVIAPITSVQEFWNAHMSLPPPNLMPAGEAVGYFREGYSPKSNDENFKGGECVVVKLSESKANEVVEELAAHIIGGQFQMLLDQLLADKKTVVAGILISRTERKGQRPAAVNCQIWHTNEEADFQELLSSLPKNPLSANELQKWKIEAKA